MVRIRVRKRATAPGLGVQGKPLPGSDVWTEKWRVSRNQSSKERLVGMWVGKLSVFKKRGNDQRGWSPARRGKSDVTWSWSGGRVGQRGDKAGLLSSHFAWLLLALTLQFPQGSCHGVAGLQASVLLGVWLRPPPCGCLALLPSLACGRFACHLPGSSVAPWALRPERSSLKILGGLVQCYPVDLASSCTACDLMSQ